MRIRLRAPEDGEAPPPPFSRPSSNQASPHTPADRLPQLDVRSPDFIEERLENLKRKPNWLTYLDQYVKAYPEDDDDEGGHAVDEIEEEIAEQATDEVEVEPDEAGFLIVLACAIAVMAMTPAWILLFPIVRHKGPDFWPLGSPSLWALYKRSVALLAFVSVGLVMIYYVLCKELPEWSRDTWYTAQVEIEDILDGTKACRAAIYRGHEQPIREICAPLGVDAVFVLLIIWATTNTHRRWGSALLVALAVLLYMNAPGRISHSLQPLPEITAIDQPYALVDEEILVAFSGTNLQPGGTITWIPYWGCASTSPVVACDLQYPSTFTTGYAAVTFTTVDHFIPCYRSPPNPLKAAEFRCFEHIRLPVKDKQSIPGWSTANRRPALPLTGHGR